MKKALLLGLALLLVSVTANAQTGYIGLFADAAHTDCNVNGSGFYPATMYIWCLPGMNGQICAEFRVIYPANIIQSTVTSNVALISVTLGDLPAGMSVCYKECQYGWNWPFQQALWVTGPETTLIEIGPHPSVGVYQFANCKSGYPTEPCTRLTNLTINQVGDCLYGVEQSSWGAIKGLFE